MEIVGIWRGGDMERERYGEGRDIFGGREKIWRAMGRDTLRDWERNYGVGRG